MNHSETSAGAVARILFRTLRVGEELGSGYMLSEITAEEVVRVTATRGKTPLRIWICPTAQDVRSYRSTARFRIGYDGDVADPDSLRVVDRIVDEVVRNEADVPDSAYEAMIDGGIGLPLGFMGDFDGLGDLQWLGVRAGLKPASRHLFGGTVLQQAVARAQAAGLHVETLPAAAYVSEWSDADTCPGDTLVFVGATAAAARAALEAERPLVARTAEARRGAWVLRRFLLHLRTTYSDDALGKALGYPSCCVRFFTPRVAWSIPDLAFEALKRTRGQASFLLNNVEMDRALIPHYPCRYDCPASIAYADALLREFERVDSRRAKALAGSLQGLLIRFRRGGHIWLRGAPARDGRTLPFSAASWSGEWPARQDWIQAVERSNEVFLESKRVRFVRDGKTLGEFRLPGRLGIARVFA